MAVAQLVLVRSMCKAAKSLQAEIERLQQEIAGLGSTHVNANAEIAKRQAKIFVAGSQLAEISTRRIIILTRWLVGLTIGIFVLTFVLLVFTICLYQDARADAEHRNFGKHRQFQTPQPPP